MNIVGYAKEKKEVNMFKRPFNNVDALIFSELAYINFNDVVKEGEFIRLRDIVIKDAKKFYGRSFSLLGNRQLIGAIKNSERYGDVRFGFCRLIDDLSTQTQFYAMTFLLPTGQAFIAYRGTDITINGWKEDLALAYQDYMPGAISAAEYLKEAVQLFDGKFYIGGHSKGGNLAVYAGLTMDQSLNDRLLKIYSFDGPGFQKDPKDFSNYEFAFPRIEKFITSNDMIGVVYNKVNNAHIVYSKGVVLGGHDPFKWTVIADKNNFKFTKDRSFISKSHEEAMMNWLVNMSTEEKQLAVDILNDLLGESLTVYDWLLNSAKNLMASKSKWDSYSIKQKQKAKQIFKQLGKYYLNAYSPTTILNRRKEEKSSSKNKK